MPLDPNQSAIAIHTSSPQLGLAIDNFAGSSRAHSCDLGRELANQLHLQLAEFIQPQTWQDLGFIAVAKGPGGFTGTRIGVVTARTLAQQLDIPLFAISSLAAVAWWKKGTPPPEPTAIALQMRAQRGELFVAIYSVSETQVIPLLPDTVMSPQMWEQTLANWQTPYRAIEVPANLGDSAPSLLQLAYRQWEQGARPHWSAALPFYGQHPVKSSSNSP